MTVENMSWRKRRTLSLATGDADSAAWQNAAKLLVTAQADVAKVQATVASAERAMPTKGAGSDLPDIQATLLKIKSALRTAARDAQQLADDTELSLAKVSYQKIPKVPGTRFTAKVKNPNTNKYETITLVEVIGSARLNRSVPRFIASYGDEIVRFNGAFSLPKGARVFREVK